MNNEYPIRDVNLEKHYQIIFDIFIDINDISSLNKPNNIYKEVKNNIN